MSTEPVLKRMYDEGLFRYVLTEEYLNWLSEQPNGTCIKYLTSEMDWCVSQVKSGINPEYLGAVEKYGEDIIGHLNGVGVESWNAYITELMPDAEVPVPPKPITVTLKMVSYPLSLDQGSDIKVRSVFMSATNAKGKPVTAEQVFPDDPSFPTAELGNFTYEAKYTDGVLEDGSPNTASMTIKYEVVDVAEG